MSRTAMASLTIGICGLLVIATTRQAPADDGCTNATLRGPYAIEASGTVLSGPLSGPTALVGVFRYDGLGQVTARVTQRVTTATGPTTLTNVQFAGTYSVNADCTAEDSLTNVANGTISVHEYSIAESGRRFNILNTTTGPTVVLGTGIRQSGGRGHD
jgi:hypothetical protein